MHYKRQQKHGDPTVGARVSVIDAPCPIPGCERRVQSSLGLCDMHTKRQKRNGDPATALRARSYAGVSCSVPGCTRQARRWGLCAPHSDRMKRHGDPGPARIQIKRRGVSAYDRVMAMSYDDASGCRIFTGAKSSNGYGRIRGDAGPTVYAHRVVLGHHLGPSDLSALHLCDVRACVNIAHLRYGTAAENTADMLQRKRAGWQKS